MNARVDNHSTVSKGCAAQTIVDTLDWRQNKNTPTSLFTGFPLYQMFQIPSCWGFILETVSVLLAVDCILYGQRVRSFVSVEGRKWIILVCKLQ
jgi:hypothetical protein